MPPIQSRFVSGCIPECYDIAGILGQNWNILGGGIEEQNENNEKAVSNGYSRKNENNEIQANNNDDDFNNIDNDGDDFQSGPSTNRFTRIVKGDDIDETTCDFHLNQNAVEREIIRSVKEKNKVEREEDKEEEKEKEKDMGKSKVKGRYK